MWRKPEARFDSACAISIGKRDTQEDAIALDFPVSSTSGFAVLADGMGGHSAGEIASRQVVTQLYTALKFGAETYEADPATLPDMMRDGLEGANAAVRDHVRENPRLHGMGTTIISLALVENEAYWLSVGDSPLYLLRKGKLHKLNQNHSVAAELDKLVEAGSISFEEAQTHPDRTALTSAIIGAPIPIVDCPSTAFELQAGDILMLASDGLQFLSDSLIERIISKNRRRSATQIAARLIAKIDALGDPEQDNVSLSVIKVNHVQNRRPEAQIVKPTFKTSRTRAPAQSAIAAQSPQM